MGLIGVNGRSGRKENPSDMETKVLGGYMRITGTEAKLVQSGP